MSTLTAEELRALPKVELHLHLDCSLSFQSVSALVSDLTVEHYRQEFLAPAKCRSLVDYFRYLTRPLSLLQTKAALRIATLDLLRQLADDNVIYAEIRFAPQLHRQTGLTTEAVVETVLAAIVEGRDLYPVETRLILCTLRPDDTAQGLELLDIAARHADQGIGGIDLAGDEAGYGLSEHIPVFHAAAEQGISVTAHAGEAVGASSVREVVELLGVRRVGHGVRSIEDETVLELIADRGVHLEVCPSCNIQIDVFESYEDHPVDRLVRHGISVGINTDARSPTNLTLTQEYQRLHDVFGWRTEDFRAANTRALKAAFIDVALRHSLAARL